MTGSYSDVNVRLIYPHDINDPIRDALRADCVAYWKMDEFNGIRIDATGRGNNLSDNNQVGCEPGKIASASRFDNANKFLKILSNQNLSIQEGESFQWCFWVKISDINFSCPLIFKVASNNSTSEYQVIYYAPDQKIHFYNLQSFEAISATTITQDQWYFIECKFDYSLNDRVEVAVNNSSFNNNEYLGPYPTNSDPVWMGNTDSFLYISPNFSLDEVLFIKRILTQQERDFLYNSGNGVSLFP